MELNASCYLIEVLLFTNGASVLIDFGIFDGVGAVVQVVVNAVVV